MSLIVGKSVNSVTMQHQLRSIYRFRRFDF